MLSVTKTNYMQRLIILIILLGPFYHANCQPNFYERTYGLGRGVFIDKAMNGNYIIGANQNSFPSLQAYYFLINSYGDTIRTMNCPNSSLSCIRQTSEGGFVFIGDSGSNAARIARVFKVDSIGNTQWNNEYPPSEWGTWGSTISANFENGYFIGLVNDGDGPENTYYIIKDDSSGNNLDTSIVQYPESSFIQNPKSMLVTPDSGMIVVPTTPIFGLIRIVKLNSSLTTQWIKEYIDSTGTFELNGNSIIRINNSGYLVTGYKNPFVGILGSCGYLLKTDLSGDRVWSKEFCFPNSNIRFISSVEDTSGNFYVSGEYYEGSERSAILIKTNSNGDTIWTRRFSGNGYAYPKCITLDNNQNPMVIGHTTDTISNQDFIYLIKTDTSGNITSTENLLMENKIRLNIFPNPVHSILSISCNDSKLKCYSFILRNIIGEIIYKQEEKSSPHSLIETIDLSLIPEGLYILETTLDGHRVVNKIVKY